MSERPILFSAEMVRAILAGRKTQTRREVKNLPPPPDNSIHPRHERKHPAPYLDAYCSVTRTTENPKGKSNLWCWWTADDRMGKEFRCPYGQPGDLLWVRETCWAESTFDSDGVRYAADHAWRIIENTQEASEAWCKLAQYGGDDALDNQTNIGRLVPSIHMPRWASRIMLRITDVRVERLQDISEDDARAEGCEPVGWIDETDVGMSSYREGFSRLWDRINGPGAWDANPYVWVLSFERVKP